MQRLEQRTERSTASHETPLPSTPWVVANPDAGIDEERLQALAESVLSLWKQAHGESGESAVALLRGNVLNIYIEEALPPGELTLARGPYGYHIMRSYLRRLIAQIYPDLANRIESALLCAVGHSNVDVHPTRNAVIFSVDLH